MFRFLFLLLFFCVSFSYASCNLDYSFAWNQFVSIRNDPQCQPPNSCQCEFGSDVVELDGQERELYCSACIVYDNCRADYAIQVDDCCIGRFKPEPLSALLCARNAISLSIYSMGSSDFHYADRLVGNSGSTCTRIRYNCQDDCQLLPELDLCALDDCELNAEGECIETCLEYDENGICIDDGSSSSGGGSSSSGGGSSSSGGGSSSSGGGSSSSGGGGSSSSGGGSSGSGGGGSSGSGGGGGDPPVCPSNPNPAFGLNYSCYNGPLDATFVGSPVTLGTGVYNYSLSRSLCYEFASGFSVSFHNVFMYTRLDVISSSFASCNACQRSSASDCSHACVYDYNCFVCVYPCGGGPPSSSSGGGGSSSSGGGSSSSGGGSSSSSGGVGPYWCDLHPDDPICVNSGYDEYCETHPDEPFCEYSRRCSQNPYDPSCGEPQPPPGGGDPPGGGSSGSSANDSTGGVSCKDLKNCDWSTLETQLVQLGVEKEVRDSIRSIIDWLKRKRHEDSLLALLRWNSESEDRRRMIEVSETLNGRIHTYYAEQKDISNRQLSALNRMDSMNGLYYASSLSGLENNRKAIDTLRSKLVDAFGEGSGDIVDAVERLTTTLSMKSMTANVNVEGTDMSGVEGGISTTNSLLRGIDSALASGNSNIMRYLDSLSAPCQGAGCGDYSGAFSGVGDDAFGGLDTSGLSSVRYDSLLSVSGSGGLQDTAHAWSNRLRAATVTPFSDNVACPAEELSIDACGYFGKSCVVSLCDDMFHIRGRHFFEWVGVFFEFVAWVLFFVRIA